MSACAIGRRLGVHDRDDIGVAAADQQVVGALGDFRSTHVDWRVSNRILGGTADHPCDLSVRYWVTGFARCIHHVGPLFNRKEYARWGSRRRKDPAVRLWR